MTTAEMVTAVEAMSLEELRQEFEKLLAAGDRSSEWTGLVRREIKRRIQ